MNQTLAVTGVSGFLGRALCKALLNKGLRVNGISRSPIISDSELPSGVQYLAIGGIGAQTDWSVVLSDVHCVIHCAARTHVMNETKADSLASYRSVNLDGTLNLARQAAAAGVKRFIFISSIKVNGEQTLLRKSFTADDAPAPEDAYGISKWEAEQGLQKLSSETGMEVVIIRPPLVYGPGVKGNFASMISVVRKGIPLPFGAISNKRSLVGIDNLIDLIVTCIDHPDAANEIFLASDGRDLSTTELLQGLARSMDRSSRLIPIPGSILSLFALLIGKRVVAQRLLGSLQVDISKNREILGWEPSVSVEVGLRRCFESQKS